MNKNLARKIGAGILSLIAVIMIFSGFFQCGGNKIIGKWETNPGRKDAHVYEFYNDNTGVDYYNLSDGETYNAESFSYRLDDDSVVIDYGLVSRVYPYEISGNTLTLKNKSYTKTESFNGGGWMKYILAVVLLIIAKFLYGTKGGSTGGENTFPKVSFPKTSSSSDKSTWYCTECGKENSLNSIFCTDCGTHK